MNASGVSPRRRGLVFLSSVMSVAVVLFVALGSFVAMTQSPGARPGTEGVRLFFLVAGFACLAVSYFLAPRGGAGMPPEAPVTAGSVVQRTFRALVFSNMGAVFGLVGTFITFRLEIVLVLGAGALAVNLLWTLPQGLRLLGDAEEREAAAGSGAA